MAECGRGQGSASVPVPPDPYGRPDASAGWLRQDYLELGSLPGAVPCARLHARQLLWEWGLTRLSDSVELAVSEMITNAAQASRDVGMAPVRLWLKADHTRVLILVWDASHHAPELIQADLEAESGRGLQLIEAVSDAWAWYPTPETGGKVIWALIGLI